MHRRLIYFAGRCDHISPLLYGRWHGEAVSEWLKFIKCRKFTAIGGVPSYRRWQHHSARLHLISHSVTASPRGEADCSLRPGGKSGATRRMRANLAVSSHQIQRIGGMRACRPTRKPKHIAGRCAYTPPSVTSYRKTSPHQSLRDSFSSRRSRLYAHRLCFRGGGTAKP